MLNPLEFRAMLVVADYAASLHFYETLLGLRQVARAEFAASDANGRNVAQDSYPVRPAPSLARPAHKRPGYAATPAEAGYRDSRAAAGSEGPLTGRC